jgi:membrane protein YqaA with SNARE-associated domain
METGWLSPELSLAGLFLWSFLAATLVPLSSEAALAGAQAAALAPSLALLVVASAGNILGAAVNWWLGRFLTVYSGRRWFPFNPASLQRASATFQRYGAWALLFSWLPVVGDPLTCIAGFLRFPFPAFILLVSIGKIARYALVLGAVDWFTH